MPDKTKAVLVKELAAANRRASKAEKAASEAEKALAAAQAEAEEGVASAQAVIADLKAKLEGHHVCPRTSMALTTDSGVYATEKRLRAERDDWRSFSGGSHGMRGTKDLPSQKLVAPTAFASEETIASVRAERNNARTLAGGVPGQRGPNGTDPGKGLDTLNRLRAERDAWLAVTAQPETPQQSGEHTLTVKAGTKVTIIVEA